jgi:SAM-dependent methyltransferase
VANLFKNQGFCPICDHEVEFCALGDWWRDQYICTCCQSIPRERALMHCIETYYPHWRQLAIHESSPADRGASTKLKTQCPNYSHTHYSADLPLGTIHPDGWQNQDLEHQTFPDQSFDLVVTQDVLEHVFEPAQAFAEIARTLKPGGAHIFTTPLINKEKPSEAWVRKEEGGAIVHLHPPEYHGNPIDPNGSLVTMHWGYDISEFILKHSNLYTTMVYIDNLNLGIRAEYIEVLVSRKGSDDGKSL